MSALGAGVIGKERAGTVTEMSREEMDCARAKREGGHRASVSFVEWKGTVFRDQWTSAVTTDLKRGPGRLCEREHVSLQGSLK